jgi:hypothetical protein
MSRKNNEEDEKPWKRLYHGEEVGAYKLLYCSAAASCFAPFHLLSTLSHAHWPHHVFLTCFICVEGGNRAAGARAEAEAARGGGAVRDAAAVADMVQKDLPCDRCRHGWIDMVLVHVRQEQPCGVPAATCTSTATAGAFMQCPHCTFKKGAAAAS